MANIGTIANQVIAKVGGGDIAPLQPSLPAVRPQVVSAEADYRIPDRVWSSWKPSRGPRELRRALTVRERGLLLHRSQALTAGLQPLATDDRDIARSALHAMFGGFRSLRQTDENAETAVEVLLAVLGDFPAWAIEEAAIKIATGHTDLSVKWPPNDAEIHAVVAGVVKPFRDTLRKIDDVLIAPVEPPEPKRAPAEVEPKRDRAPVEPYTFVMVQELDGPDDGKHAQRVMAELEAKRARREAAGEGA